MRRYERSGIARKLDDDIKLRAIVMFVPTGFEDSSIEDHLTLNKHRLKSFRVSSNVISFTLEARTGSKLGEPIIKLEVDALGLKGGRQRSKCGKSDKGNKDDSSAHLARACMHCAYRRVASIAYLTHATN